MFDGVDTVSSISLNGVVLGRTDNMFRRYVRGGEGGGSGYSNFLSIISIMSLVLPQDFQVTELLRDGVDGVNVLNVSFLSPVVYASERRKAHGSASIPPECPPDVQKGECHVNFIRKVSVSTAVCVGSHPVCPAV